jgi:hypothetical protein
MPQNLLATTKYRGKLTISFPTHYSAVTIQRKSSNWLTNMLRLYPTKKFEVVGVEWAVGGTSSRTGEDVDGAGEGEAEQARTQSQTAAQQRVSCTSTSSSSSFQPSPSPDTVGGAPSSDHAGAMALLAQAWWREWHVAAWNGVMSGRKGWVTVDDWIEAKMGVREKDRGRDWGVDYE